MILSFCFYFHHLDSECIFISKWGVGEWNFFLNFLDFPSNVFYRFSYLEMNPGLFLWYNFLNHTLFSSFGLKVFIYIDMLLHLSWETDSPLCFVALNQFYNPAQLVSHLYVPALNHTLCFLCNICVHTMDFPRHYYVWLFTIFQGVNTRRFWWGWGSIF